MNEWFKALHLREKISENQTSQVRPPAWAFLKNIATIEGIAAIYRVLAAAH